MTLAGLIGILIGVYVILWVFGLFIWMALSDITNGYGHPKREEAPSLFRWKLRDSFEAHGISFDPSFPWRYWQLAIYGLILVGIPILLIVAFFIAAAQVKL